MKVLLIEDELVWQIKIRMILEELGWELVKITPSVDLIGDDIATTQPNLILSDIVLNDISVFTFFKEMADYKTPIVFMTNRPSENYYESTKNLDHSALLIKPFHALTLKSTVDLLFEHYTEPQKPSERGIWVRGKHNLKVWIEEEKILWIHSNGNYCFIQTAAAKYSVKGALSNLANSFSESFIQTHRAYLVNTQYIQKVELTRYNLFINKQEIPISRKYKEQVVKYLLKKEVNQL
ncbi:MAG: response regulator transcription factor [Saprospiraceae bacterium]|nr:response regulator transcription factor [Saprospiraceae bacterium]